MTGAGPVIDAWMQHPTGEWIKDPMFDSLRAWKPGPFSEGEQPLEAPLACMDEAGVALGLLCAWWGPEGALIDNRVFKLGL